jgi:4'-phosphopantetheinyl transferase
MSGLSGSERIALPEDASLQLWRIDLRRDLPAEALQALSGAEHARASRLRGEELARRYRHAHAALRLLLAERLAVAPRDLAFAVGSHGKPWLPAYPRVSFSLSRRGDVAVVAIGRGPAVGVDVELPDARLDALALAQGVCSPSERAALAALPPAERATVFLRAWTRKEACLKAIGCGLTLPPETVEVGLERTLRTLLVRTDAGRFELRVQTLDAGAGDATVISWAESRAQDLRSSRP